METDLFAFKQLKHVGCDKLYAIRGIGEQFNDYHHMTGNCFYLPLQMLIISTDMDLLELSDSESYFCP
jgi:hypothetical protein